MLADDAQAVLAFWFDSAPADAPAAARVESHATPPLTQPADAGGQPESGGTTPFPGQRAAWFRKDPAFDAAIRSRFEPLIAQALAGGLGEWCHSPRGALARVLLLDQFTRNVYRDTPRAFAGDARALATADDAIARGFDRELSPLERWFLYMPFQHSEVLADQERSVALFRALAADTGLASPLSYVDRHAEIVRRFGRFPHRNAILGRASTPEEVAFLRTPNSAF